MWQNYFKIILRGFARQKGYVFINVIGLTVGITACLLIFLLIRFEQGFDKFHSDQEQIYRLVHESYSASGTEYQPRSPYPMPEALRQDLGQGVEVVGIHTDVENYLKIGDKKFKEDYLMMADSNFFDVFDYGRIGESERNELRQMLSQPNLCILSESAAKKFFGGESPIGKRILVSNRLDMEVVKVMPDLPQNTHLRFNILTSIRNLTSEFMGFPIDSWGLTAAGATYVKLPPDTRVPDIESAIAAVRQKYVEAEVVKDQQYYLQPLSDVHFDARYFAEGNGVTRENLWALGITALMVAFIACINFVNLATALAIRKAKEVGIRKTLGASRSQLFGQYMGEAAVLTLISVLVSLGITERTLPLLANFLEKPLSITTDDWGIIALFLLAVSVLITLLSGAYPAMVLSGYQPVKALKSRILAPSSTSLFLRKGLVIFQFFVAQVLIICTLVVAAQMRFFQSKSLGFSKEAIVNIFIPEQDSVKFEQFRQRAEQIPQIEQLSFSLGAPTSPNNLGTGYGKVGSTREERFDVNVKPVDRFYLPTYGMEMAAGRWFTEADERSSDYELVVNEMVARQMGYEKPEQIVGTQLTCGINDLVGEVVGVVKDFHTQSLHEQFSPVIFLHFPSFYYNVGVKLQMQDPQKAITQLESIWNNLYPDYLFEYTFMEDTLDRMYRQEARVATLIQLFAAAAILIGCLGLLGLISFVVNQKTKEIGVRKILGATVPKLMLMLSKEFAWLIIGACLLSFPLGWILMERWLSNFAFRISLSPVSFLLAAATALAVAMATVAYHAWKAANANPVDSLRSE